MTCYGNIFRVRKISYNERFVNRPGGGGASSILTHFDHLFKRKNNKTSEFVSENY